MGKIVKYCNACEESFAEKFGFCPICGESLTAFEMNPIEKAAKTEEKVSAAVSENYSTDQLELPETNTFLADEAENDLELDLSDEIAEDFEPVARPKFSVNGAGSGFSGDVSDEAFQTNIDYTNHQPIDSGANNFYTSDADDDFHITVLTEKNVKERNFMFLGIAVLMLSLSVGVVIASLFNHDLGIGAIGEDDLFTSVPIVDEKPMTVEEEVQQKKDDKDAGGGGGGGRDEQTPTSKGVLATQVEKPLIAPDVSIIKRKSELQQDRAATQGKNEAPPSDEPYGDPNAALTAKLSNGLGTGGGQGSGVGTGQGSGRGTGQGSGIGSGSGSGIGDGTGSGKGSGVQGDAPPKVERPPAPAGPSTGVKFISKPQPKYTDAARQNNVQGNVTLRITFLANGQIGSISPVSGLSYGLTEQAIAAARQIRFEPAMRNGQPYSVTKSVQYTFTIY
jgi:protein TonB